uniref:Uncharacterized protein n=1 Tax=Tetranychus urticae TaxID=32264 RepID=T1KPZ7_TETUR
MNFSLHFNDNSHQNHDEHDDNKDEKGKNIVHLIEPSIVQM